ncbi:MAG: hypothetical protein B6245_05280 [Desulfobacteraceae bacterium 4572_88]|nr:MAG: hypothetical protein B6245_05280 [Desulfobacteraceae bacterium 4572_88]
MPDKGYITFFNFFPVTGQKKLRTAMAKKPGLRNCGKKQGFLPSFLSRTQLFFKELRGILYGETEAG